MFNFSEERKLPFTRVWEDYFAPHPGETQWEQLPESIKDTVKRTSEELQRYAVNQKHPFGDDERTALLK